MHYSSLSIITAALGFLSTQVLANSGYAASCSDVSIQAPDGDADCYSLEATCGNGSGGSNLNFLNLGSCFGNSGGKLVAELNGAFGRSCGSVKLSGTTMSASCGNGKGGSVSTSINLNNYIGNAGGTIYCFNQAATCVS